MQIKKTVGYPKLDMYIKGKHRKGYVIHTECGEKFHAKPVGSQSYECGGNQWRSLKALKHDIRHGDLCEAHRTEEPTEVSTVDGEDTWDCVHPCALLITKPRSFDGDLLRTLGNYGWLRS